ncbi:MAG: DUF1893 domain-containing protein [Anaerolineae bacterium]
MNHTLEVYRGHDLVFYSDGNWLHPLFELERFLETAPYTAAELTVHDKIVGRAAALLLVRLGVQEIRAGLMSELALDVLDRYAISYRYRSLVPRINCKTEALLAEVDDPDAAYVLLEQRARRSAP